MNKILLDLSNAIYLNAEEKTITRNLSFANGKISQLFAPGEKSFSRTEQSVSAFAFCPEATLC